MTCDDEIPGDSSSETDSHILSNYSDAGRDYCSSRDDDRLLSDLANDCQLTNGQMVELLDGSTAMVQNVEKSEQLH